MANDIIDINVYETVETVDITVQPNLTTININSVTGGGAVSSVNGQTGDVIIAVSENSYTTAEKNKLAGIQAGAEVNVNADWNATSGDAQILNKPTIPTAVTQTSQLTNNGADGTNPFITALDIPTTGQASTLVREVKNMTGATLVKGTVVYISGANGNKPLVSKALATTDALSARTFGLLQSNILNNGLGNCVIIGDLTGLDTSSFTDGTQLYLSGTTAGTFTSTKTSAPNHLVYVGKVTRSHPTLGQIEIGIQNGYELDEIHDVAITSPINEDFLQYETSTSLWKNIQITASWLRSKLGITTLSGSNTGDQDLSGYVPTTRTVNAKPLNANVVLTTADIADSTGKRYQTENQNLFNDATSSIQTQINNLSYIHKNHIYGIDVLNNPNATYKYAYGVLIPANTIKVGDFVDIEASIAKVSGGSAEAYLNLNINTIDSLTGATIISTSGATGNPLYLRNQRALIVKSASITEIFHQGTQSFTGWASSLNDGNKNIDWTINQYIIVSIRNIGALDCIFKMSSIIISKR